MTALSVSNDKRDPRMDPKPGDMLRWRDRERHVVNVIDNYWYSSGLGGKAIDYLDVRKAGSAGKLRCSLDAWQKWAQRIETTVVQTAELTKP